MRKLTSIILAITALSLGACLKWVDTGLPGFDLINAVRAADLKRVQRLLDGGADINAVYQNLTPLMAAAEDGNLAVAKFLVEHGAKINQSVRGATALNYSVFHRRHDFSLWLLESGADPGARPSLPGYDSALATALLSGDKSLADALLAHGAPTYDASALAAAIRGCGTKDWDNRYAKLLLQSSPELREAGGVDGTLTKLSLKLCPPF